LGLTLEESKEEATEKVDGVELLLDEQIKPFASGQVVDYIDDQLRGTGFIIQAETGNC